jgi:tRNA/rRNA methyltransferase
MRNMGLSDLVLVAPEADPADKRASRLSTHGQTILDQARTVARLEEAVADCVLVVGTSARTGGLVRRQSVGPPDEIMPRVIEFLAAGPVALVFGPERTGLTNAEVVRCHYLITIPAAAEYPSLNLGQAVGICLYELRRTWLRLRDTTGPLEAPAAFADQERAYEHLRSALEAIHFLYGPKADALMHALRHLLGRAGPTGMEVEILHGLARQLLWYVAQRVPPPV